MCAGRGEEVLVGVQKKCNGMRVSTYSERLAQALRLPLGPGSALQALLTSSGAASNG